MGCSRPHLVKLLESGEIAFTKVGKHRRVKFEDVMEYKARKRKEREEHLIEMMKADAASELYVQSSSGKSAENSLIRG